MLEHPVLDYDDAGKKCICRAHPCWDVGGIKHGCSEDSVLRYRENLPEGGAAVKPDPRLAVVPSKGQPITFSTLGSDGAGSG
mmetsp:Transcript_28047/g.74851  ORF Transcript_28047/g.74851 Transcript_28047/m.74851 type:complete len:82 (+) Transcript_28047:325-570(+)